MPCPKNSNSLNSNCDNNNVYSCGIMNRFSRNGFNLSDPSVTYVGFDEINPITSDVEFIELIARSLPFDEVYGAIYSSVIVNIPATPTDPFMLQIYPVGPVGGSVQPLLKPMIPPYSFKIVAHPMFEIEEDFYVGETIITENIPVTAEITLYRRFGIPEVVEIKITYHSVPVSV
ncbi:MAG: hypothetical protein Hyperionvirus24_6 [Hyperionvirus sp.]|uniref:Uncharacterized protein n=1 Tax=Hyperionvirus sp. TaxID=2487770 RepID=A0A3G5ACQ5_9VIRU|nr:MAG: hypothetical protein Hyperionvirus24_6 [Hyperionvirus sp.]